jgi:aspartate 4-decarboxylase
MTKVTRKLSVTLDEEKEFEKLSPFELKDKLIALARDTSRNTDRVMLNAGRGNPNWISTTPRGAFFTLGNFGLQESNRTWSEPDLGGMPQKAGIANRFEKFVLNNPAVPSIQFLSRALKFAVEQFGFDTDNLVHELVDGIIGDQYPFPDRMLEHAERVVHEYLLKEMSGGAPPAGKFDLFAVEGGTAAMCYIFESLLANGLVQPGDKIALAVPTFTPYLEIPQLDRFSFDVVEIKATEIIEETGRHSWQYPDSEIDNLADPEIRVVFFVNPSNPPSVAIRRSSMERLSALVRTKRPDLLIVTDDVYGTFVPEFRARGFGNRG